MLIIFTAKSPSDRLEDDFTLKTLKALPNINVQVSKINSGEHTIYQALLEGSTQGISTENIASLPGVLEVIPLESELKLIGKKASLQGFEFNYNGVDFSQRSLNLFLGLCAVDNQQNVEHTFKVLSKFGLDCARMGVYKPRTSPYYFQGLGKECLNYVFELAGKYNIKVIAMEVMHPEHIDEIDAALQETQSPTGVMLQIGTRNAQNFSLLKAVGSQNRYPVLFKRGFGITLNESLHAAEYLAKSGNKNIIFCLRGVKSLCAAPHRNLTDFSQVPVIKRLTNMPVGIDPSHAVGSLAKDENKISDIFHATAQGILAGANLLLADVHPHPPAAIVDSRQAISLDNIEWYLEDINIAYQAYRQRQRLASKFNQTKTMETAEYAS